MNATQTPLIRFSVELSWPFRSVLQQKPQQIVPVEFEPYKSTQYLSFIHCVHDYPHGKVRVSYGRRKVHNSVTFPKGAI